VVPQWKGRPKSPLTLPAQFGMRMTVRRFSFPKEGAPPPRKLYDKEKWRALLKYDREIVLIAEKLLPLGGATRFVAEVAASPFENHLAREGRLARASAPLLIQFKI
jgi:hypothetical protein